MRADKYGFDFLTAEELAVKEFPPLEFLVDGLLPLGGCAMLAAPPKRRKSFLVQDLCLSVATGRPFIGRKTRQGCTLYLALEDGLRRLQTRQSAILGENTASHDCMYAVAAPKLGAGLSDAIRAWKSQTDGVLVAVDVFQRIRPEGSKTNDYQLDYGAVAPLNDLANELGITIMLIHHTRKMENPDDVFQDISGSNGIYGALTTVWMLRGGEQRDEVDATLFFQGKDVESDSMKLRFNRGTLRFEPVLDMQRVARESGNALVRVAKRLLEASGKEWCGTATDFGDFAKSQPEFRGKDRSASGFGRELNGEKFRRDALKEGFDVVTEKGCIRFLWR